MTMTSWQATPGGKAAVATARAGPAQPDSVLLNGWLGLCSRFYPVLMQMYGLTGYDLSPPFCQPVSYRASLQQRVDRRLVKCGLDVAVAGKMQ
jgi:hypothetical protein